MRRIVYLIEQPFDERNYQRFGVRAWTQRGWAAEVWDLTPCAHPDVWRDFIAHGKQVREFAGYYPIASIRALLVRLRAAGRVGYFIDLTTENFHTTRAKMLLKRLGVHRIACAVGSIPVPDRISQLGLLARLGRLVAKGPRGALKWISHAFFYKVVARHVPSDWTIVAGERSMDRVRRAGRLIRAHNFDYDIYLELMRSTGADSGRYAVFLDQDYCFHPEYVYQSVVPLVTPERYFPAVCRALRAISHSLGVEIRVAAHPRSTYRERGLTCFDAFPLEYGRTGELVRDCSAVVCHDSTAIQFAVLFGKPAIFLITEEQIRSPEGASIVKAAAELGKTPINLDLQDPDAVDWQQELTVDLDKYQDYIRRYIKAQGSSDKPVWEIVIDEIETADRKACCQ